MPIRKPVFSPPFNVVRASHVELACATSPAPAPFMSIAWAIWSAPRSRTRSICGRSRSATTIRSCCARRKSRAAHALGFKLASEDDLDRAAAWFARQEPAHRVSRGAPPGPHAAHRRLDRHAARILFQDGPGRAHAAALRRLSGRAHPAHRPHQLLHARRAGELRLLHRARLPPDRIHRDRRPRSASSGRCGCTARATSTTSPSPTAAGRGCTTSASGPRARSTSCTSAT